MRSKTGTGLVGLDIIRHHLHTVKWGLFVLYIDQNNSNHKNKNRKVRLSVGLFEDLVKFKYFSRSQELFSLPRFLLFLKWKKLFLNVFLWPVVKQHIGNNLPFMSSVCLHSDRSKVMTNHSGRSIYYIA